MKKIGILTFARVANFGANLQGLSTYYYLKNHGYDPIFIDWEPLDFSVRQERESRTVQGKIHFDFFDSMCKKTQKCRDEKDVASVIEKEEIIGVIIGSDAVLQHHPLITRIKFPTRHLYYIASTDSARMYPNPFWGTFMKYMRDDFPVVIISGSSQNSPYKWFSMQTRAEMYKNLSKMKYISVRDEWTKSMIKYISNGRITPSVTPDPVFAFNFNCKDIIPSFNDIKKKYKIPHKYILVSFLNNSVVSGEWIRQLKKHTHYKGFECVALPMPDGIKFDHNFDYEISCPLSPIDWYALIKYSCGYIGQNMHPVVVALHNSVPVYSFDSYGETKWMDFVCINRSSKIYHILNEFGIEGNRTPVNIRRYRIPSVELVVRKLTETKTKLIGEIAEKKKNDYFKMMSDVMSLTF